MTAVKVQTERKYTRHPGITSKEGGGGLRQTDRQKKKKKKERKKERDSVGEKLESDRKR